MTFFFTATAMSNGTLENSVTFHLHFYTHLPSPITKKKTLVPSKMLNCHL